MARTSTSLALPDELWQRDDLLAAGGRVGPRRVLDELGAAGRLDLERVSVGSFSLRAVTGGS